MIDIKAFNVAGVQFRPADDIEALGKDEQIRLVAEPENKYDSFAIRVECKFIIEGVDENGGIFTKEEWRHIGYVPKKDTWIFHLMRKLRVTLFLKLLVNHDATPQDMLLVTVKALGDENALFQTAPAE